MVSTTSTSSGCGTAYREKRTKASTTCSASCPAARAFHSASGVTRYVCTCSGERSSSANGAIAARQSRAAGWSTSSSSVLSDWTIRGPSDTGTSRQGGGDGGHAGLRHGNHGGRQLLPVAGTADHPAG